MSVHIGKIIKKLVKKKGISVTEFAGRINYSRRNVYEIFDRETIDTGLLIKINKVLEENLFLNYINDSDISNMKESKSTMEEMKEVLNGIKAEVQNLKDVNRLQKDKSPRKKSNKKK